MRKILNISIIITIILGMLTVCVSYAMAEEIYVEDCIQEAIDFARNGDVIILRPDIYVENINFLGKAVTVRSTDPLNPDVVAVTIIDGGRKGSVVTFENGEGNNSVLSGLTLQNGEACYGGGIFCLESSPRISYCNIINNSSSGIGGGIYCSSSSPIIISCNIIENLSSSIGSGIYCSSSSPIITNCIISRNSAFQHDGGTFTHVVSPIINNFITPENRGLFYAGEIYFSSDSLPVINNCNFGNDLPREEVYIPEAVVRVPYSNIQGVYTNLTNLPALQNPFLNPSMIYSFNPSWYLPPLGYSPPFRGDLQYPFLDYQSNLTNLPALQIPFLNPLMIYSFNPSWYLPPLGYSQPFRDDLQYPFLDYQSNLTNLPALQIPFLNPLMAYSFNPVWYHSLWFPPLGYSQPFRDDLQYPFLDYQINPALYPPDLVVESISISPEKPSPGDTIEFTAVVRNIGFETAESCKARFTFGDGYIPSLHIIPALQFGQSHTLKRVESFSVEQKWSVTVYVDIFDDVDESKERNNQKTRIFHIFGPLNVMTLNARVPDDGAPNRWWERLSRIIRMLQLYESGLGPHIIGMQELTYHQWINLRHNLPSYLVRNKLRKDRGDGESIAILYRPNRLLLLDEGSFYLGIDDRRRRGGCPHILRFEEDKRRRVVVWGRFRDKFTNKTFYVFNTHFPSKNSCERRGSALIMAEQIKKIKGDAHSRDPVIAMGDFNDGQNPDGTLNISFKMLLENTGLVNSYRKVHDFHESEQFSTLNKDYRNIRRDKMIDFVLVSPSSIRVVDANIDRTMFTSDCNPVICNQIDSQGRCIGTNFNASNLLMYSDHWAVWASLVIEEMVTVYEYCDYVGDYRGYSVQLPRGEYNLSQLLGMGVHNDSISSIIVPPGFKATLFEHNNFQGGSWIFTNDYSCFYGDLNDAVSSIIVE